MSLAGLRTMRFELYGLRLGRKRWILVPVKAKCSSWSPRSASGVMLHSHNLQRQISSPFNHEDGVQVLGGQPELRNRNFDPISIRNLRGYQYRMLLRFGIDVRHLEENL